MFPDPYSSFKKKKNKKVIIFYCDDDWLALSCIEVFIVTEKDRRMCLPKIENYRRYDAQEYFTCDHPKHNPGLTPKNKRTEMIAYSRNLF